MPPRRDLLILIDYSAAKRGAVVPGERCEIAGVGPIPVDVALDFDADPFIKAVIRDGTDIGNPSGSSEFRLRRNVSGRAVRSVPAELRTALEARGLRCAVLGCSNTAHLEIDRALVDYADGGPLALWNAQYLCTYHHRLKTLGQLEPLPPPGDPPPAEAADPSEADALTRPPPGSPP
ncbi:MAG: HNH endonuclease [Acidimicrobiia bacterium]|nr:HNH endonuclease [Acidimicrobiia bacterium]